MFENFPYKKLLFVGVGGIGISALAKLLKDKGYQILGLNDSESKETLDELSESGVDIFIYDTQKDSAQIPFKDFDAVVYSIAWDSRAKNLMNRLKENHKVFSYAEALGLVSKNFKTIAIAGTHGKTTTTAMTLYALKEAGVDASGIVGSLVDFGGKRTNYIKGSSDILVIEACEYKRHFLNYSPFLGVITNIDFDHPDYYKDEKDYNSAFEEFKKRCENVIEKKDARIFLPLVPLLKVPGKHNRENASFALAVADFLGADLELAKKGLGKFPGTWRRIEYVGKTQKGALVFDDYAHHPKEIKAVFEALKEKYPEKNLIAIYEPHMYSRTKALMEELAESLSLFDEVFVAPIYPARENPIKGVDNCALKWQIENLGTKARCGDFEEAQEFAQNFGEEDLVIFMGAGDIYKIAEKFKN